MFNYVGTNNAEGVTIYHDGVEVGSSAQKVSYERTVGPGVVVIGKYNVHSEQDFASVMVDELLFFNRIITADEVQILYDM